MRIGEVSLEMNCGDFSRNSHLWKLEQSIGFVQVALVASFKITMRGKTENDVVWTIFKFATVLGLEYSRPDCYHFPKQFSN